MWNFREFQQICCRIILIIFILYVKIHCKTEIVVVAISNLESFT